MSINMALAKGEYLHCTNIEIIVNLSLKATKEIGYGHLKNSGERFRPSWPSCLLLLLLECNTNFWLAKPYSLASHNLCYIQMFLNIENLENIWLRMFSRMVGEYGPRAMKISLNIFFLKNIEPLVPSFKVWYQQCYWAQPGKLIFKIN